MIEKFPVGEVVRAKVMEVLPNGAVVELEEGSEGFLPAAERDGELEVGAEVVAKVIAYDRSGRPVLSQRRVSPADLEEAEFHREVLEFRSVLSNRSISVNIPEAQLQKERVEWRLARWLSQAETLLRRRQGRPSLLERLEKE